ncbi:unnamed protein product [Bursaphelenchus okinawaensis]|uniref:Uncharacterized protein n=1 Tax=Bursaphelenchus okinawaensis TaxID=465554 RepID=A0A811K8Z6_9BILA|nr:unnamed protein product [Bursaphelenchus okinawaensis]CAG9095336.1 unnamed protein product [Bursaphelenchus okinawaensis]
MSNVPLTEDQIAIEYAKHSVAGIRSECRATAGNVEHELAIGNIVNDNLSKIAKLKENFEKREGLNQKFNSMKALYEALIAKEKEMTRTEKKLKERLDNVVAVKESKVTEFFGLNSGIDASLPHDSFELDQDEISDKIEEICARIQSKERQYGLVIQETRRNYNRYSEEKKRFDGMQMFGSLKDPKQEFGEKSKDSEAPQVLTTSENMSDTVISEHADLNASLYVV